MARVHSSGRLDVVVVERDEAEARIAELEAALRDIATMKPQIIGDTGFQTGPQALIDACQRKAREAIKPKRKR